MKNILFTYFPLYVGYNYGISLLTSLCKQNSIDAMYVPCGKSFMDVVDSYDIIGFSFVTDEDYKQCLPYLMYAKSLGKEILAGGVYARRGGKIDRKLVDHICRGEADVEEGGLVDYLLNDDRTVFELRMVRESIDGLPSPDMTGIKGTEFSRGWNFLQGIKMWPYQSSRGCWYGKCTFCEIQNLPECKKVRIKHTIWEDLTKIIDTVKPNLLYLFDELPPYNMEEWREQWLDIRIPFLSYIRADITQEDLLWMINHGLKVASFGIECGDEIYRNNVLLKGVSNADIIRTVSLLRKNNVFYIPTYMVGLPGETPSEVECTKKVIENVGGFPLVFTYHNLRDTMEEGYEF